MTAAQRRLLQGMAVLYLLVVAGAVALFAIGLPVFGVLVLVGVTIGVVGLLKLRRMFLHPVG